MRKYTDGITVAIGQNCGLIINEIIVDEQNSFIARFHSLKILLRKELWKFHASNSTPLIR